MARNGVPEPRAAEPGAAEPGAAFAPALIPTIFHEPWWLDKATAGRCAEIQETIDGRCVGRLPYLPASRFGLTSIRMPMLTHFLGPAIDEGRGSETTRLIKRISIAKAMIARLPKTASVWIKCHRDTTDTLAFQDAGFVTLVQFTSEIMPAPESKLWAGMRDTARRVIRRAAERLTVIELDSPDRFMAFYERNLKDRNLPNSYDPRICAAVITECLRRGVGRILAAVDDKNDLHAGVFTVWDRASEYYLMTTRRLDSDNGATSLLIWHGIKHAAENGIVFDLDGYSTSGDIQFFTRFGGVLKPRYGVQKASAAFRMINKFVKVD